MQHKSILIIEISANRTAVNYHFTICTKCINTCRNQSICIISRNSNCFIFRYSPKTYKARAATTKVVCAVNIMNTLLSFTIFHNVIVTIYFINTVNRRNRFISCTIFIEDIPIGRSIRVILYKSNTCIHISIKTEVICFTFNFLPCTSIETWSIAISCTISIRCPRTFS